MIEIAGSKRRGILGGEHGRRPIAPSSAAVVVALALGSLARDAVGQAHGGVGSDPDIDPQGEEEAPQNAPANPHAPGQGGAGGRAIPGIFQPPEDTEREDPAAPAGTIEVDLRDADDTPLAGENITLGILINSIAKGDSRKHEQRTTDGLGRAVFGGLETSSGIAYRVSSGYAGGAYAAMPFQLGQGKAMHVTLHVYPVTHDLEQARVVCESAVAAEVKDDRIQVEEALTVYNVGRVSWQPIGIRLALPHGATAFTSQASMSDQGVDQEGSELKLRGTFSPGQHGLSFRFQLPWSGEKDVAFDVGMPPHVAVARVVMPASKGITLDVPDFPRPDVRRDAQGQSFLVTDRRVRPDEGKLTSIHVGMLGLPTPGPGRFIATLLAAVGVAFGLVTAATGRGPARALVGGQGARQTILDELLALEEARASGEVGPKTYERARREWIDALAETLASEAIEKKDANANAPPSQASPSSRLAQ